LTIIKINAITVSDGSGADLARRFAERAGAVDSQEGFEGFELLEPTDDRTTWLVVTRWRDQAAFDAWVTSPAFAHGHRPEPAAAASGEPAAAASGEPAARPPAAMQAELWSYDVALTSEGNRPG
jgi:heme-degrading monooxygenase HmoA